MCCIQRALVLDFNGFECLYIESVSVHMHVCCYRGHALVLGFDGFECLYIQSVDVSVCAVYRGHWFWVLMVLNACTYSLSVCVLYRGQWFWVSMVLNVCT